jgi:hypothetical protein
VRLASKLGFSAEGAKYDSQGQALSRAKRVAPGLKPYDDEALKERNNCSGAIISRTFSALLDYSF